MSPGNGKKRDPDCCSEAEVINGWRFHIKWRPQNETTEESAGVVFDADLFQLYFPLP